MQTQDQDMELIELFKKGDVQAFEQIVVKYKAKIAGTVYSIINSSQDVEDVVQDIFLIVYKSIHSFKGNSSFSTWLYRITINRCFYELKKRKHKVSSIEDYLNEEETLQISDILRSPEENLEDKIINDELRTTIHKILDTLPEKYRIIFILKNINGLSYKEIAQTMNISMNKVKVWLFRAREKLEDRLRPYLSANGGHHGL